MQVNMAYRLLNPMNRLKISGKPTLSSNASTEPVEEESPPQNLYHIENAWKLGKEVLQPNRPRSLSKYRAPSAKYESLARNYFVMNMDIDTTASAKQSRTPAATLAQDSSIKTRPKPPRSRKLPNTDDDFAPTAACQAIQ